MGFSNVLQVTDILYCSMNNAQFPRCCSQECMYVSRPAVQVNICIPTAATQSQNGPARTQQLVIPRAAYQRRYHSRLLDLDCRSRVDQLTNGANANEQPERNDAHQAHDSVPSTKPHEPPKPHEDDSASDRRPVPRRDPVDELHSGVDGPR